MIIRSGDDGFLHPRSSEITPREVYLGRREWMRRMALGAGGLMGGGWWARDAAGSTSSSATLQARPSGVPGARTLDKPTAFKDATGYNNFYEFGLDKDDPAARAGRMKTRPWTLRVEGLVHKPRTFDIDDLLKLSALEERIYRLRCVEGWSMVIPWIGYSLAHLLRQVEPMGSARYVAFETLADRESMPGLRSSVLLWPYVEGLRLDEAQHPLTLLTLGMYGQVLPNQNGAPVRLMVPWKYGFKSGKSLVSIRLVEKQPVTSWNAVAPHEYGFYANVNPDVPHPRWSQATERRIGEGGGLLAPRRKTLLFNGYAEQVGQLYAGLDLRTHY